MKRVAKITFRSTDSKLLTSTTQKVKRIADRLGASIRGPIPMKTKRVIIPCRKSPDGEGSETWDHWKISFGKVIIYSEIHEKFLKALVRENISPGVKMSILFNNIK